MLAEVCAGLYELLPAHLKPHSVAIGAYNHTFSAFPSGIKLTVRTLILWAMPCLGGRASQFMEVRRVLSAETLSSRLILE